MKKLSRASWLAVALAAALVCAATLSPAAGAATLLSDSFADGNSNVQNLANGSVRVFKGRAATARQDAVGSVTFDMTATGTSAEGFWGFFTEPGSPVNLGVGDKLSVSGTFSLTGFVGTGQDIRFGVLNSLGTRNANDLTGGMNDASFAGDPGYALDYFPSNSATSTGSPFAIWRRSNVSGNNPFNSAGDFTTVPGSGSTARQPLANETAYTLVYTVERLSDTDTRLSVSVTGGALSNHGYTSVESSTAPNTAFDYFGFRVGGAGFAQKIKFTNWKVDYTPSLPVITSQPQPSNLVVQVGSNVTTSVGASGNALAYEWRRDGQPIPGNASAATPTLTLANVRLADAGVYTAVVSNPGGSTTSQPVTLAVSADPVPPPPAVAAGPQDATPVVGEPASLSVAAAGDNLFYQWFKNGALVPGANSASLAFAAAQVSDSGSYTVVVSNPSGSVTSAPARLLVVSAMRATGFGAAHGATDVDVDAPLHITFDRAPKVGSTGRLRVFREDGALVDTIDLSLSQQTRLNGAVNFNYRPVIVTGNTAAVHLHQKLAHNQSYYVTAEPGVLTDAGGAPYRGMPDAFVWGFSTKTGGPVAGATALTVAADGTGDFATVQGAVDFVPANNNKRVVITVRKGTYTEIVYVGSNKPFVTVRGEDRDASVIQYANNNTFNPTSTTHRAMFGVDAADFTLENITLRNTTPQGGSQAEAFRGNANRIVLNRVSLYSYQDTLLLQGQSNQGGYVTDSYIEGDVDFLWGSGAVFFRNTELKMLRTDAFYTQIRNGAGRNGYVFVGCKLTRPSAAITGAYLTRIDPDDFPFSQVVFINTRMDAHVRPDPWRFDNPANAVTAANYPNVRFWEYNTTDLAGAPVNTSQRHPISRQLTPAEAAQWSDPAFVLGGWNPQAKLTAAVSLSNLSHNYTGAPAVPAVTTSPAGLNVEVTYNGGATPPTAIGSYAVVANVVDDTYQGTAAGTLVIDRTPVSVTLSNLSQAADGRPKAVTVNTSPAGAVVRVTYNGSAAPPAEPGRYSVVASIDDPSFRGGASATLTLYAPGARPVRAFPGAEGAGELSRGGRGGDVYHVTNLNDSGPGSLREGVRSARGPRTIVFDVSGTIQLASRLSVNRPFLTIAGQTAPGDGVTVAGWPTVVDNTNNVVIRYMRFRAGDANCPAVQDDAFWVSNSTDVVVDHVSASWSVDETLSVTESDRVTVQWSFITESMRNSCHEKGAHGYGSLVRYGSGVVTYHHNLFAHHDSRNPRLGDNVGLDFVNNVVYNWGGESGYTGPAEEGSPRLNFVGNYLVAGPSTPASKRRAFSGGGATTQVYQANNLLDGDLDGRLDGVDNDWAMFVGSYARRQPARFDFAQVDTDDAATAYGRVLAGAGHSLRRDAVDERVAGEVRGEGGRHINSQTEVGGFPLLTSAPAPADTDRDGMPDAWEAERGLDPADPADGRAVNGNGYTNLERYLNGLAPAPEGDTAGDATQPRTVAALSRPANEAGWHNADVTVLLAAADEDGGSGVHQLVYSVDGAPAAAVDTADVSIPVTAEGTTTVVFYARDQAGNAEAAQTLTVRLDKTAPVINVARPAGGEFFLVGQPAAAGYACSDNLSGATCAGTFEPGAPLDTATAGGKTFEVSAVDAAGNAAAHTAAYAVGYEARTLYDALKAHKGGSNVPVRLQLVGFGGVNLSAASAVVRAVGVGVGVAPGSAPAASPGDSHPGGLFDFDPALGGTGGYHFNLKTTGLAPGAYNLYFTVGDDPRPYAAPFVVR